MARILVGGDYLATFNSPRSPQIHTLIRKRMRSLRRVWRPLDAMVAVRPVAGYDLLHTINRIPLTSKPWITTFESILPRTIGPGQEMLRDRIRGRLLASNCKKIIAMSHYAVRKVQVHNRGWDSLAGLLQKISVIHPSVPLRPRNGGYAGGELSVVFVGNDFARKGGIATLRMARQALKMRLPVKFHIVSSLKHGRGVYTDFPDSVAYAEDLKLLGLENVEFHSTLPNDAVLDLMARSHFLVLPTMDDTYGFSVLEAMAAGTPVIVSAVCALPEVVQTGKNGFALCLPVDENGNWAHWNLRGQPALWDALDDAYSSLAAEGLNCLAAVIERPDSWQSLSQGAIEHVRMQHDSERNGAQIEEIYTEALSCFGQVDQSVLEDVHAVSLTGVSDPRQRESVPQPLAVNPPSLRAMPAGPRAANDFPPPSHAELRLEVGEMQNNKRHTRLTDTVEELREDIFHQLLPTAVGTTPSVVNVVPLSRRSMHDVAAVEMGQNGSAIRFFAKADSANYQGPQRLEAEEQVLRDIAPEIWHANARTRCPQVLAFFPERKLLLLEMVEGKSLKQLLFDMGTSHANLGDLLALSGEWLARFHSLTQGEAGNPFEWLDGSFAEKKIRDVFDNCGVSDLHPALANLLHQFRLDYPDFRRPLCRVHGEYTPLHILVQNDSIYVIDFGSSRWGFGYEDVAIFTTFFDILLPWRAIAGSLRLPLREQKNIFRESYLAHCQQTFDTPDHIVTRFASLQALARHAAWRETIPASPTAALYATVGRAWVRKRFAAMARRELAYLQQLGSAPPVWHLNYSSPAAD